jgi:TPR repeat protein/DNA-binding XRE family transcriptional regulator
MTQPPPPDLLGSVVRRYREEELQLSQADFAWLAAISRGTISNMETGRVTPDERTWHRIRTALALPPVSLAQARNGVAARPVITTEALRGIVLAILAIRDHDADIGRRAAERWRRVVIRMTREGGQDHVSPEANNELTWLAYDVARLAPPGMITAIHDALRAWGWSSAQVGAELAVPGEGGLREVQALVSTVNHVADQLRDYHDRSMGFDRLPKRVQQLLTHALVVGEEITDDESSPEVSVVSLIVMNEAKASLATREDAHDAALRWRKIMAIATHLVDEQAPDLSADEIIGALKVGLDASSPAAVKELLPYAYRGDPRAMYKLARLYRRGGRPDEAYRWIERAAEAGHPGAFFSLGTLAQQTGEHADAEFWYARAAEAGHPDAMYSLWLLLREEVPEVAERWLRKAADIGNRYAMYQMWLLHREMGELDRAELWLRRAANSGHRQALADLSRLIEERNAAERDPDEPAATTEAARWLYRAAEQGDSGAINSYELMLYEMQLRQRAAAGNAG